MLEAQKGSAHLQNAEGLRIGIVKARFNEDITNALYASARDELLRLGMEEENIIQISVPGALEVPLGLQALAKQGGFDALIAIGCIIRGETYHFELVANESGAGVTRVSLDWNLPIANAILTTEDLAQATSRLMKGQDAARVAIEMANLITQFS